MFYNRVIAISNGMKIHRFIVGFGIKIGDLRLTDTVLFNQLRNVLKLKVGEIVILGDGKMNEGSAEIISYGNDFIEFNIQEINSNNNESERKINLYCSILKKENFELVVQKATEIGVSEIIPLITSRTVKLEIRKERLEKIIKEAAEQSGRGVIPILYDPVSFNEAIQLIPKNNANIFFDSSGKLFENWKLKIENSQTGVWVGPEGGWTLDEIEMSKSSGFEIISLGSTTLRAETAAIIGAYFIVHN